MNERIPGKFSGQLVTQEKGSPFQLRAQIVEVPAKVGIYKLLDLHCSIMLFHDHTCSFSLSCDVSAFQCLSSRYPLFTF